MQARPGGNSSTCTQSPCYCALDSSPAIDSAGSLYFGNMFGGDNGNAIAYYKNGTMKWMVPLGLWVISNPAISPKDVVYFGSESAFMYAFNEDGSLAWKFGSKCSIYSNAEVAPSGNLYFGEYCGHAATDGGYFTAITSSGALLWEIYTGSPVWSSAVANPSETTVYIGCYDKNLYALKTSDGTTVWTVSLCGAVFSSPALAADGTIYVGAGSSGIPCPTNGTYFYAINPNGSIKWKFMPSIAATSCQSSPFVGPDGTIYFGCSDSFFYALNPDGSLRWKYQTAAEVVSDPIVASDGTVYVGGLDSKLYTFNRPCVSGYYCPVNSTAAVACPGGSYNAKTISISPSDCLACNAG